MAVLHFVVIFELDGNSLKQVPSFLLLQISEFNGELQGKNGPGFSFLLFGNGDNASLSPKFSSTNHYTITEDDYDKVWMTLLRICVNFCICL